MMAKKNKKRSFAEEAKRVIQRYKRRLGEDFERFDPMAVDAMNRELETLMQRQEETRAKMLEADQVKMCRGGKLRRYARGGNLPQMDGLDPRYPSYLTSPKGTVVPFLGDQPWSMNPYMNTPIIDSPEMIQQIDGTSVNPILNQTPTYPDLTRPDITAMKAQERRFQRNPSAVADTINNPQDASNNSWWTDIPTTAKISTLANVAGAVGSGLVGMFNRPEEMKYTSVAAPKYTPVSDEEAVRQAELAYQDAMRASRGLSPGRYYSQMGQLAAGRTGATAGIKERTANINAQGINQNAWRAAQLALQNEQGRLGAQQYNQLQRDQYIGNIASTIGNVTGAIALGAKDVQAYDVQQQTLPYLSQANYQVRLKDGKLVNPVISRGGLSFYRDPKSGEMEYFDGYERLLNKAEYDRRLDKLLSTGSLSQSKPV